MLSELAQDVRYGIRGLLKAPGFAAVAILTLALGVGANSAIFSFVDGVLLKPLPYPDPDRILLLWEEPPGGGNNVVSAMNFMDWRSQSSAFTAVAAITGRSVTLTGRGEPTLLRAGRVSAGYFDILGIKPTLGRTFAQDEDTPGKEHVVVLSHRLWATQFGGDGGLVGRSIVLDGEAYTVIGVMPEGAVFDRTFNQLWRPLAFTPGERTRNFHWLRFSAIRVFRGSSIRSKRAESSGRGSSHERGRRVPPAGAVAISRARSTGTS